MGSNPIRSTIKKTRRNTDCLKSPVFVRVSFVSRTVKTIRDRSSGGLQGRVQGCLFIKNLFLLPFIKKESGFFYRIILLPHPRQACRLRIEDIWTQEILFLFLPGMRSKTLQPCFRRKTCGRILNSAAGCLFFLQSRIQQRCALLFLWRNS